jgi:hypothetical protein
MHQDKKISGAPQKKMGKKRGCPMVKEKYRRNISVPRWSNGWKTPLPFPSQLHVFGLKQNQYSV